MVLHATGTQDVRTAPSSAVVHICTCALSTVCGITLRSMYACDMWCMHVVHVHMYHLHHE